MHSRRSKRDRDGWKLSKRAYYLFINSTRVEGHMGYSSGYREEEKAPNMVKAVGSLFKHLSALSELFKKD